MELVKQHLTPNTFGVTHENARKYWFCATIRLPKDSVIHLVNNRRLLVAFLSSGADLACLSNLAAKVDDLKEERKCLDATVYSSDAKRAREVTKALQQLHFTVKEPAIHPAVVQQFLMGFPTVTRVANGKCHSEDIDSLARRSATKDQLICVYDGFASGELLEKGKRVGAHKSAASAEAGEAEVESAAGAGAGAVSPAPVVSRSAVSNADESRV